jgi:DNA-binding NarL/FixJ family response regulator
VPISLLIVDDHPVVRDGLRGIFTGDDRFEVVGEAVNGTEAITLAEARQPDVVLMDLRMPGVDGLTAIERIVSLPEPPAVVALTTFDADQYVIRALRAGAAGFLVKSTPPADLLNLVRVAADGHMVLSPAAAQRLVASSTDQHQAGNRARALTKDLTKRETDVLACLGKGMSNASIAAQLHLSEATVKGYVSRMLVKLDCLNRTQAGLLAHEAGLLSTK